MHKILLIIGMVAGGMAFAGAQENTGALPTGTYNENVVVTAPYQPSLVLMEKPVFSPKPVDTILSASRMDYEIISRPFFTTYPIENIKPAKILGEPIPRLWNNRVKVGFGNHLSPLAELNFGMGRDRKYEVAAYYRHHSAYGKVKGYDRFKTNHSLNEADVIGRIFSDKFISSLNVIYSQQTVNCYGYGNWDTVPDLDLGDYKNQSKRWYQNARGILSFTDNARNAEDLRFDATLDYNLNMTNWRSAENTVIVDGGVSKVVLKDRKSVDVLQIGGRLKFEDNTYRDGIKDGYWKPEEGAEGPTNVYVEGNELLNAWHLNFQPTLYYKYDFVELDAALVFHVFGNSAWGWQVDKASYFQFNPVVDLKLHVIDKVLTFFIGTGGGVERNTLDKISRINPFLHPTLFSDFEFTRDKFNAYAGLRGNFSKSIDYRIKVSAHFMENVLSFDYYRYIYSWGLHSIYYGYNDFVPIYSGNVFNLKLRGDLNFRFGEKILAHLDATYNHYSERLYYSPEFMANLAFKYNIIDGLSVHTDIRAYTNMKALDRVGDEQTIKGCFDWSIGAEYRFIKRMTVFLDLNNLLSQRYYMWYDYPSYRFNFMVGLTVDF